MKATDISQPLLGKIRQRLGAKDENDASLDQDIEKRTAEQLVSDYCGWELGDENWGYSIISIYKKLLAMKEKTKCN